MVEFDTKSVSPLEWGVIGGGAAALVAMFMPWYGIQSDCPAVAKCSVNAWDAGFAAWFGSLLIVAAAGVVVYLRVLGRQLPQLPVGAGLLAFALAVAGAALILLRVLTFDASIFGVEFGRKIGAWIGLLAGIIAAASAYLSFKASGEPLAWDATKIPRGAAGAPPAPGSWAPPEPVSTDYPPPPPPPAPPPPPPLTPPDAGHDHAHDHDGHDHDLNGHDHPH